VEESEETAATHAGTSEEVTTTLVLTVEVKEADSAFDSAAETDLGLGRLLSLDAPSTAAGTTAAETAAAEESAEEVVVEVLVLTI
jgi:hypothetical protein